jgi:putative membrane protein
MMTGGLTDWYFGWGWILWLGFIFLLFFSFGSWGHTYRVHQKVDGQPRKEARDILNEKYARGEITKEQLVQLDSDISSA